MHCYNHCYDLTSEAFMILINIIMIVVLICVRVDWYLSSYSSEGARGDRSRLVARLMCNYLDCYFNNSLH